MNMKKLGLGLATALALAGCSAAGGSGDKVKVGGNFEMSGEIAAYGTPMANALNLAVEQKNANGGVLSKQIEALVIDNKSDKTEAASVATKLTSENVAGIVGPAATGMSLAEVPVVQRAKVPAIFPAATGDDITLDASKNVYEYIFRTCFEDRFQGVAAANQVYTSMNMKKAVVLTDTGNDYSQGLTKSFTETYTGLGGTIVANESYASNDTDFTAVLTSVKSKDFDVLYIPGYYKEAGLIIKQAREMGITQPIVGGDGFANDTLVQLAGKENLSNVYYTSHFSAKSEDADVQSFVKAYTEKYGSAPDTFAALAYDASNLLLQAIERAGSTDPTAVAKALAETKDFKGVTGSFSMGANHTPVKTALMLEFQNGEEVKAETITVKQ